MAIGGLAIINLLEVIKYGGYRIIIFFKLSIQSFFLKDFQNIACSYNSNGNWWNYQNYSCSGSTALAYNIAMIVIGIVTGVLSLVFAITLNCISCRAYD